jgi:hypothetical protein
MIDIIWQDLVLTVSKIYALYDTSTVWSRWASLPNAVLYIPSIVAFFTLELYLTAFFATCSMLVWFGIGIWRAP